MGSLLPPPLQCRLDLEINDEEVTRVSFGAEKVGGCKRPSLGLSIWIDNTNVLLLVLQALEVEREKLETLLAKHTLQV